MTIFVAKGCYNRVDVEDNLATYHFCCVPFGMNCGPFLLATTIKFHLQKEGTPLALIIFMLTTS